MSLVEFMGATASEDERGNREYKPRGPIWINPDLVAGVYDHTILTSGNMIRVMENVDQILEKIQGNR